MEVRSPVTGTIKEVKKIEQNGVSVWQISITHLKNAHDFVKSPCDALIESIDVVDGDGHSFKLQTSDKKRVDLVVLNSKNLQDLYLMPGDRVLLGAKLFKYKPTTGLTLLIDGSCLLFAQANDKMVQSSSLIGKF